MVNYMNIENEIFKRCNVNFKNLEKYEFKKEKNYYLLEKNFLNNARKTLIKVITSNTIAIYDLYTIAYINQHIADITPTILILFSSFDKKDIITIVDAIIGNIEYIFWKFMILIINRIITKNIDTKYLFFNLYLSNKYILTRANKPIKLHIAPVIPFNK